MRLPIFTQIPEVFPGAKTLNRMLRLLWSTFDGQIDFDNIKQDVVGDGLEVVSDTAVETKKLRWKYSHGYPRWIEKDGSVYIALKSEVSDYKKFAILYDEEIDGETYTPDFVFQRQGAIRYIATPATEVTNYLYIQNKNIDNDTGGHTIIRSGYASGYTPNMSIYAGRNTSTNKGGDVTIGASNGSNIYFYASDVGGSIQLGNYPVYLLGETLIGDRNLKLATGWPVRDIYFGVSGDEDYWGLFDESEAQINLYRKIKIHNEINIFKDTQAKIQFEANQNAIVEVKEAPAGTGKNLEIGAGDATSGVGGGLYLYIGEDVSAVNECGSFAVGTRTDPDKILSYSSVPEEGYFGNFEWIFQNMVNCSSARLRLPTGIDANKPSLVVGEVYVPTDKKKIYIYADGSEHVIPIGTSLSDKQYPRWNNSNSEFDWAEDKKVVQHVVYNSSIVYDFTTSPEVVPFDDTKPRWDEIGELLNLSITPKDESNILTIKVKLFCSSDYVGSQGIVIGLWEGSSPSASDEAFAVDAITLSTDEIGTLILNYSKVAGSVSTQTWRVGGGIETGGTLIINGRGVSRLFGTSWKSSFEILECEP